jgi:hypothetical protein
MIRWNAAEVMQRCDEAEAILKEALPTIERAAAVLAKIKGIDNMPQYITQPVSGAVGSIQNCGERAKRDIDYVRSHVPKEEVAKCRYKGKPTSLGMKVERIEKPTQHREFRQYTPQIEERPIKDGTRRTQLAIR